MRVYGFVMAFVAWLTIGSSAHAQVHTAALVAVPPANWQLLQQGPVSSDLAETVWKTAVPPFGPFDYISVHRLTSQRAFSHGKVVLFLPGATANGNLYTLDERY